MIQINYNLAEHQPTRDRFEITDRSQYVLIDDEGNVLYKWYGFLDEGQVSSIIDQYLSTGTVTTG